MPDVFIYPTNLNRISNSKSLIQLSGLILNGMTLKLTQLYDFSIHLQKASDIVILILSYVFAKRVPAMERSYHNFFPLQDV
jgi:hypothetical protein